MALVTALAVGSGGTLGAIARHAVGERLERRGLDTLVVNVVGSLLLGMVLGLPVDGAVRLAAATGFCGAFTTYSSFAVETVRFAETSRPWLALAYAAGTLALAVAAVLVGMPLGGLVGGLAWW